MDNYITWLDKFQSMAYYFEMQWLSEKIKTNTNFILLAFSTNS